jgi:hypothetical protein
MPGDTEPKLAPGESFHLSNTVSGSSINSRSALGHWFEKSRLDFARREAESGETASDFMLPGGNKILLPNSEGNVFFRRARGIDFNVLERTFSQIYILRPVLSAFIAIFFWLKIEVMLGLFKGYGVNSLRGGVKHSAALPLGSLSDGRNFHPRNTEILTIPPYI